MASNETERFNWPIPAWNADWQKWQEIFSDLIRNIEATVFASMSNAKLIMKELPNVEITEPTPGNYIMSMSGPAVFVSRTHLTEIRLAQEQISLDADSVLGLTFTPGAVGPQNISWEVYPQGMDTAPEVIPVGYVDDSYNIIWYTGVELTTASGPQRLFAPTGGGSIGDTVKVSLDDTTAGYLNGKLVAGSGISLTEVDPGSNETLEISATGGSGDVVGPGSATDDNVAKFDGSTGKIIKDSGVSLSGSNTGDQTIELTGEVTGSGTGSFPATVADNVIDEANLKLDTGPTNDFVLVADSTKSGGMKWAANDGGGMPAGLQDVYIDVTNGLDAAPNNGSPGLPYASYTYARAQQGDPTTVGEYNTPIRYIFAPGSYVAGTLPMRWNTILKLNGKVLITGTFTWELDTDKAFGGGTNATLVVSGDAGLGAITNLHIVNANPSAAAGPTSNQTVILDNVAVTGNLLNLPTDDASVETGATTLYSIGGTFVGRVGGVRGSTYDVYGAGRNQLKLRIVNGLFYYGMSTLCGEVDITHVSNTTLNDIDSDMDPSDGSGSYGGLIQNAIGGVSGYPSQSPTFIKCNRAYSVSSVLRVGSENVARTPYPFYGDAYTRHSFMKSGVTTGAAAWYGVGGWYHIPRRQDYEAGVNNTIYVDGFHGDDTQGDGSKEFPYATLDKVFDDWAAMTPLNATAFVWNPRIVVTGGTFSDALTIRQTFQKIEIELRNGASITGVITWDLRFADWAATTSPTTHPPELIIKGVGTFGSIGDLYIQNTTPAAGAVETKYLFLENILAEGDLQTVPSGNTGVPTGDVDTYLTRVSQNTSGHRWGGQKEAATPTAAQRNALRLFAVDSKLTGMTLCGEVMLTSLSNTALADSDPDDDPTDGSSGYGGMIDGAPDSIGIHQGLLGMQGVTWFPGSTVVMGSAQAARDAQALMGDDATLQKLIDIGFSSTANDWTNGIQGVDWWRSMGAGLHADLSSGGRIRHSDEYPNAITAGVYSILDGLNGDGNDDFQRILGRYGEGNEGWYGASVKGTRHGSSAGIGRAQVVDIELTLRTTDDTETAMNLYSYASSGTGLPLPTSKALQISFRITAASENTAMRAWKGEFGVIDGAIVTGSLNVETVTQTNESGYAEADWDIDFDINTTPTPDEIRVLATGDIGKNVDWLCALTVDELYTPAP